MTRFVVEAYVNDPSVVDEFVNVCSAVNVFAVYVFGIVVEAWMYALTFVSPYAADESEYTTPVDDVFNVPAVVVERVRFPSDANVVDALMNDEYAVDDE